MGSSPDNFDSLQKLLRLKRYEQPAPRYFNEFSSRVLARIEAGEARTAGRWWERFGVDLRPILTFAAGTAACCLVFFSVGFSFDDGQSAASAGVGSTALAGQGAQVEAAPLSSTNPINPAGTMMLDSFRVKVQPASFQY